MIVQFRFAVLLTLAAGGAVAAVAQDALTPQQVVERMTNAYATCRSYQDVGETVVIPPAPTPPPGIKPVALTNTQPFSIQFRRPSSLRFEFSHQEQPEHVTPEQIRNRANWPRFKCILWVNGEEARIYSEKTHTYWQGAGLSNGIIQATALSQGCGRPIVDLLTSPSGGAIGLDIQSVSSMREDEVEGARCYVLSGHVGHTPAVFELWIGQRDFLLRKRRIIVQYAGMSSIFGESHRDIQANRQIPDSVFAFNIPRDAQATTNALSLLPDVERQNTLMRQQLAEARHNTGRGVVVNPKSPSYIDCRRDGLVLYPGETRVSWDKLQQPKNTVDQMLDEIQEHNRDRYVIVMVRPQSVKYYRTMRNLIGKRPIDVGYEPVDADFEVKLVDGKIPELEKPQAKPPAATVAGSPVKPVVRSVPTNKSPVFFECRNNEVFFVDRDGLDAQVTKLLEEVKPLWRPGNATEFLKAIQGHEVTNDYYRVNPQLLPVGVMALDLRAGAHGDGLGELNGAGSKFRQALANLDAQNRYIAFLVRDDSFEVFRNARVIAETAGFDAGWELLGTDESIKFGSFPGVPAALK